MATILAQVGWRTAVLAGGYKTYRRRVQARLYDDAPALRLVLLDGHTGSGKTEMLRRLAARGVQTLDLEGLAEHRGSLFGGLPGRPQPSQKMFESRLLAALGRLDPARPIVVEAESSKVGDRMVPPALWSAMTAAPRIESAAPAAARAPATWRAPTPTSSPTGRRSRRRWRACRSTRAASGWRPGARSPTPATSRRWPPSLIEAHYDPAYDRAARKETRPRLAKMEMAELAECGPGSRRGRDRRSR